MIDLSQAYDTLGADLVGGFSLALLVLVGLVLVVWDAFRNDARELPWVAAAALGVALVWEVFHLSSVPTTAFYDLIRVNGFASFINLVVVGSGLFTIVLAVPYLRKIEHGYGEVYALILFATAGMILLGTANNLISIFVGLETMSVCLYILTGLVRDDEGAIESALKYFLLGAFSTGFFLYGIALLYGASGTMYLPEMAEGLAARDTAMMFWAGVALFLIGFLFKVSAVPFHMWTPDVYQGAPTPLTGYMSTASKASAFASLILVLFYALPPERWSLVLAVIAVATMVLGNVLALAQNNVKRMLAYSSIAHAGYVLVGLAAGTADGYSGALYYLLIYSLMNIGAFGVMALLEWDDKEGSRQTLDSLSGIGFRKPLLGVAMGVFMFSLTGFPPLGGFFGKVAVFAPAIEAGLTWLAIIGVLASVLSAYYYLRILFVFWMKSPDDQAEEVKKATFTVPTSSAAVIIACAVLLLIIGFVPGVREITQLFFEQGGPMALMP
ncbi:MAG TPA: NADH-quinone oxidoreductase subunit N [Rhodothermales bacterium]|nr:NADH-quinone oxidoreductase subunit N [Rhodothermales bacterium]